jgi:hypothetical protein
MIRAAAVAAGFAATTLAAAGPVLACSGERILFDDDFTMHEVALWGKPDKSFEIKDGRAQFRPDANHLWWSWNTAFAFDDADICVTITLVETTDPTRSYGGLMFWVKDNDNFYSLDIASNGFFQVRRKIAGKWTPGILPWTQTDALKHGPSQPNKVRVSVRDQTVAVQINDKDVARFRAQPPDQPSFIGLLAVSATAKADTWNFSDLKVTNVK